jgi:endonuclease/exonuclease/phosphatase family metal-dependent hydrolase
VLIAVLLTASSAFEAAAGSLPIQIDGVFSEWGAPAAFDPTGDPGASGVDFSQLWIANDENWLFIRFDTGLEIEPDEGHDVRIVLDTDDNAGTGAAVQGVGAELVWSLGQRSGTLYLGGGSQATSHSQIGLTIAPTVSGTTFELAIRRDATGAGALVLFPGSTVRVVIADFGSGGDAIGAGTLHTFDPTPQPVPSLGLGRADPSHVRVASYNVQNDGLFTSSSGRQAAQARVMGAVDADVWILNEVWNHDGPEVEAKLEQLLPTGPGVSWTAVNPLQGVVVASRFPVLESATLPVASRDWVAARIDPRPRLDSDLVVMGNHWKAFSGASEDATRQDQADGLIRYVADMRAGTLLGVAAQTPIIAGGDFNLVGIRQPLTTATTGDIIDESTWGPDAPPDWDGSDFDVVVPRHPDQRLTYTWRNDSSPFYPGRLDWMFYTGSVITLENHFALETRSMTPANLTAHGLLSGDTGTASDHAPIVADFSAIGTAGVGGERPVALRLAPASPNPFKGSTRISFGLPRDARLSLRVFDVTGRIVRVLTDGRTWPAGTHAIHWDGMGDDGQTAAPGIYLAVLKTDRGTAVRRMVRLR